MKEKENKTKETKTNTNTNTKKPAYVTKKSIFDNKGVAIGIIVAIAVVIIIILVVLLVSSKTTISKIIEKDLANTTGTPDFSKTSCAYGTNKNGKGCGEDTTGLYKSVDDDGTTYYYRGSVEDNYVKFAGFYWRIVRINGDGSIRIIYDGTEAHENGESSTDRQIGKSAFNTKANDNAYVGYMYGLVNAKMYSSTQKNTHDSTIKTYLDEWYKSNLKNYEKYIDTDAGFCGDRTLHSGKGYGTELTFYSAYERLRNDYEPTFKCEQSNDLYTVSSSSKGNKALTYPIGLISIDEVAYAGGTYYDSSDSDINYGFYLYTGQDYWTMTPHDYIGSYASVFYVEDDSDFFSYLVNSTNLGVRPVINLKSDTKFKGTGTMDDPYKVE